MLCVSIYVFYLFWRFGRFHTDIPDEFLFTSHATIVELAKTVKHGSLTEEQHQQFDTIQPSGNADADGNSDAPKGAVKGHTTTVIEQRQPLCPWFTCCY